MQLLFASERVHALPWLTAHLFPCAGVELYIIPAVPPYSSIPAQRKRLYTETKQEKEGGGDFFSTHTRHTGKKESVACESLLSCCCSSGSAPLPSQGDALSAPSAGSRANKRERARESRLRGEIFLPD
jgi:hypothetical protein